MIACVNPAYSSANHTINTLRYSDRLKEKTSQMGKIGGAVNANNNANMNLNVNLNSNLNANKDKNFLNNKHHNPNTNFNYLNNHPTNNNNFNKKMKEIDDINMQVFNLKDDKINDIDFDDRMNVDDRFNTPQKDDGEGDDWEYLKKTVSKEGKYLSDDFIRYHQITDQLVEDEDAIVNTHMNIIKVIKISCFI